MNLRVALLLAALTACAAPALAHPLYLTLPSHHVYTDAINTCDEPVEVSIAGVTKTVEPEGVARFELCAGTCPGHEDACERYTYTYTYTARTASPSGESWDGVEVVSACALNGDVVGTVTLRCGARRALLAEDDYDTSSEDYSEDDGGDDGDYDEGDDGGDDSGDDSDTSDSSSDTSDPSSQYTVSVKVVNNCVEPVEVEIGGPDDVSSANIDPDGTKTFEICYGYCTDYEGICKTIEYMYNAYVLTEGIDYDWDSTFFVDSCAVDADSSTTITLECADLAASGSGTSSPAGSGSASTSPGAKSPSTGTGSPSSTPGSGTSASASASTPAAAGTTSAAVGAAHAWAALGMAGYALFTLI